MHYCLCLTQHEGWRRVAKQLADDCKRAKAAPLCGLSELNLRSAYEHDFND